MELLSKVLFFGMTSLVHEKIQKIESEGKKFVLIFISIFMEILLRISLLTVVMFFVVNATNNTINIFDAGFLAVLLYVGLIFSLRIIQSLREG